MVISRTPFRISFLGGGTDYPVWYREHGGAVLSSTIDKYCYISLRWLPPYFDHKHRIVYSRSENVMCVDEIEHPSVRETMRYLGITDGVEIHHDADLPARSGLGSSSAFTVGLLNALRALLGRMSDKAQLARQAIEIEQERIAENVGSQDQVAAAYGGLNRILFNRDGSFEVQPLILPPQRMNELSDHLLFFYTGVQRFASVVAAEQIKQTPLRQNELHRMRELVDEGMAVLIDEHSDIEAFGRLLHEGWLLKRSLTGAISNAHIDNIYNTALSAGATGGKLIGAGGGGFMLFLAPPQCHAAIRESLHDLLHVPVKPVRIGSQIIFYEPTQKEPVQ
ncbi:MAG: kinase [Candidatus Cloacimonetes bacterium]|nr:kinase [Candidatus Cloacimonadota bacterium]